MLAKITGLDMIETADNSGPASDIGDPGKPLVKDIGGFNFIADGCIVSYMRQAVKAMKPFSRCLAAITPNVD